VAEYEALFLGLRVLKDMGIEEIAIFGDVELIFHQIKNIYQDKNPSLKTYRNEVWDLIDNFFLAFNILVIPREENTMVDSLAISGSHFKIPLPPKLRYEVEVRYRSFVPNNIKHWKLFEYDLEIRKFLEFVDKFSALHIDQDQDSKVTLMLMYF
jgi:hypothetical protein